MLLRKINAGLSLLSTVLLLDHVIFNAVRMLSRGSIEKTVNFMPWALTAIVALHAFISIDIVVSDHMNSEKTKQKSKNYLKMNLPTIIQRASGVCMVIFAGLHIAGATGALQPPPAVHAILPTLFFAVALAHTAISTGKAFITLGIGNAKTVKVVDVMVKVVCAIALIAAVAGFYLYLV